MFIEEYLICWNAKQAAINAGYEITHKDAAYTGIKLLEHPKIREAIQRRIKKRAMDADEIVARLSSEASADIGDFVDIAINEETGEQTIVLDLKRAKEQGLTHLIKSIKPTKHGIEFELHDAQRAKQLLARIYGMTDHRQNEQKTVVVIASDELAAARVEATRRRQERFLAAPEPEVIDSE